MAAIEDRLDVDPDLPGYPGRGTLAGECLDRYFFLLERTRADLRNRFSDQECGLLLGVCDSPHFDEYGPAVMSLCLE